MVWFLKFIFGGIDLSVFSEKKKNFKLGKKNKYSTEARKENYENLIRIFITE